MSKGTFTDVTTRLAFVNFIRYYDTLKPFQAPVHIKTDERIYVCVSVV